ncbi:MAG TPA: GAF domain-containing protein [Candidatus Dormibacteraeota bacterium]
MRGLAARLPLPVALFTAAGILILAGASFNVQGHTGKTGLEVMAGGLLAVIAGITHRRWRLSVICGLAAIIAVVGTLPIEEIRSGTLIGQAAQPVLMNLLGVAALVLGGVVGSRGYAVVTAELRGRVGDLEHLNRQLAEQHRIFLAATEEPSYLETDAEQRAQATAVALGAAFCVYYLATPDGQQFAPDGMGYGFTHVRPGPLARGRKDGLVGAIDENREFVTEDRRDLAVLFRYFPPDFQIDNALAAPIHVGDQVGGFLLVGDKYGGFSEDDRRLARTLATRAGISFANVHAVALSQKEAGRYALLNELVREASGMSVEDALDLVLDRGREFIQYDGGRVALLGADGTFTISGSAGSPAPIAGTPLEQVRSAGHTVIRRVIAEQGLYSGLRVPEGTQACEALIPVGGKTELFGILCLGRRGAAGFTEEELPTLEELGAIVGLAVENSRILQTFVGQATRLDSALDVLGEVSRALTTTTQGRSALEEMTARAAMRITGCDHVLLTRTSRDGTQRMSYGYGFPNELSGLKVNAGQGLIGAVMLSGAPLALPDATESLEMSNPPDLVGAGLSGAMCVPMLDEGQVRGTISVFSRLRREWSEDDVRSLSTLANATLVALKNAELYDQKNQMVWELSNLHEGLRAVTSTLELDDVLELVLGWAARASEAKIGCLALEEGGVLQLRGAHGTDHETAARLALGLGGAICQEVMSANQPHMENTEQPARSDSPLEPRSVLCVPIPLRDQPIGVIFLANYGPTAQRFSEDHQRLVSALGAQAAVAIDNARLFRDTEELFLGSLNAFAAAVDARDPYTAGHSQRVTEYALAIAKKLDYAPGDENAWKRLKQGGLLHDVGKIGVPDGILQKPAPLTKEEFDLMKQHPVRGFEILRGVKLLTDELVIVRSHHERFDGHGYPDGLRGDQLALCAWIVQAADALDAMTSDRPYRKGMDLAMALAEIRRGAGTHFHPDVARALLDAASDGTLTIILAPSMYSDAPVVGAIENR